MNTETKYAINKHGDAVYKLKKHGEGASTVATLTMTTGFGEESYPIKTLAELEKFVDSMGTGSARLLSEDMYTSHRKRLMEYKLVKAQLR